MAFSILPLERPSQTRKVDWRIKQALAFHEAWLPDYHPRWYYRLVFRDTSHPGWQPPEFLSQMMYDMSNLPGAIQRQKKYLASNVVLFKTTDVGAIAAKVRADAESEAEALRRETDAFIDARMASFESVLHKTTSQVHTARARLAERSGLNVDRTASH